MNTLTTKELATIMGVKPATVRRYKFTCGEPIMGHPKNGYLYPIDQLAAELRARKFEMLARRVEQGMTNV